MTIGGAGATWKGTGWYVTPKSSSDVMQVLGRIGVYSRGQRFAWRGLSSADFDVTSSLQHRLGSNARETHVRDAERAILKTAREWGLGVTESAHVDDLQLLADLQHYGAPTRLLDFTSNPMTALWFACQEAPEKNAHTGGRLAKSGVLLALNITKWRRNMTVGEPYGTALGKLKHGAGWTLTNALASSEPFVVEQSVPNARLRAQEGFFVAGVVPEPANFLWKLTTPFHSLNVPFDLGDPAELSDRLTKARPSGFPKALPFVAIIIGAGLKPKLLSYLDGSYDRRARTLFPDYQGYRDYGLPPLDAVPLSKRPAAGGGPPVASENVAEDARDANGEPPPLTRNSNITR